MTISTISKKLPYSPKVTKGLLITILAVATMAGSYQLNAMECEPGVELQKSTTIRDIPQEIIQKIVACSVDFEFGATDLESLIGSIKTVGRDVAKFRLVSKYYANTIDTLAIISPQIEAQSDKLLPLLKRENAFGENALHSITQTNPQCNDIILLIMAAAGNELPTLCMQNAQHHCLNLPICPPCTLEIKEAMLQKAQTWLPKEGVMLIDPQKYEDAKIFFGLNCSHQVYLMFAIYYCNQTLLHMIFESVNPDLAKKITAKRYSLFLSLLPKYEGRSQDRPTILHIAVVAQNPEAIKTILHYAGDACHELLATRLVTQQQKIGWTAKELAIAIDDEGINKQKFLAVFAEFEGASTDIEDVS